MEFIDTHCHLDFPEFDQDRAQILQRCRNLGVTKIICLGVRENQWTAAENLAQENAGIYWSLGLHPWFLDTKCAREEQATLLSAASDKLRQKKCVALGETGLDFLIELDHRYQQDIFLQHLSLASEHNKPVIVHSVKAHAETLRCIKQFQNSRGVIHAFSGSYEQAKQFFDAGFLLGVGGLITYARANKTRAALAKMPMDALLLETDAPSMPLSGRQGQRNSPEYIPDIAASLAQLRDETLASIAAASSDNARALFALDQLE